MRTIGHGRPETFGHLSAVGSEPPKIIPPMNSLSQARRGALCAKKPPT